MDDALTQKLLAAGQTFLDGDLYGILDEDDLFAVRFGSGNVGYCVVSYDDIMDDPALSLYMDGTPMASYMRLERQKDTSPVQSFQAYARLERMMCLGMQGDELMAAEKQPLENAGIAPAKDGMYPVFLQKHAFEEDHVLQDETSAGYLLKALQAATYLAGQLGEDEDELDERGKALGFDRKDTIPLITVSALSKDGFMLSTMPMPDDIPVRVTSMTLDDPALVDAIRAKHMRGKVDLLCELVAAPLPLDTEPPRYPVGLLMLAPSRKIVHFPFVEDYAKEMHSLMAGLVDQLLDYGMPTRLLIRDETTALLLHDFCEQIALPIKMERNIPQLDAFIEAYYDHVAPDDDEDDD